MVWKNASHEMISFVMNALTVCGSKHNFPCQAALCYMDICFHDIVSASKTVKMKETSRKMLKTDAPIDVAKSCKRQNILFYFEQMMGKVIDRAFERRLH